MSSCSPPASPLSYEPQTRNNLTKKQTKEIMVERRVFFSFQENREERKHETNFIVFIYMLYFSSDVLLINIKLNENLFKQIIIHTLLSLTLSCVSLEGN